MEYKIKDNVKQFILGGNSYFTIKNEVSGKFCKYHIKKSNSGVYFVSVKESNGWKYGVNGLYYKKAKGFLDGNTKEIQGLLWVIRHARKLDDRISVIHHGKCACCGRKLDDEKSVKLGFGPICYKNIRS